MLCCLLTTSLQLARPPRSHLDASPGVDKAALVPVPWVALQGLRVQVTQACIQNIKFTILTIFKSIVLWH